MTRDAASTAKTVYVVKSKKDGRVVYLRGCTCFDEDPLVEDALDAKHFESNDPEDSYVLEHFLSPINVKGASSASKSGVWVDEAPEIVKIEIIAREVPKEEGTRLPPEQDGRVQSRGVAEEW